MHKIICFDMSGVLVKSTNFWMELHKRFNTYEKGKVLTDKYLHTDYDRLVEEVVVKLWKGLDATPYFELVNSIEYTGDLEKLFSYVKSKGYLTAIISGSSLDIARILQKDFGVDYLFANHLVIKDKKVAGTFIWPIGAGFTKKAHVLKHLSESLSIPLEEFIYVGDDETDIDAMKIAGKSIAINPRSDNLRKMSTHVIETDDVSDIIRFLE